MKGEYSRQKTQMQDFLERDERDALQNEMMNEINQSLFRNLKIRFGQKKDETSSFSSENMSHDSENNNSNLMKQTNKKLKKFKTLFSKKLNEAISPTKSANQRNSCAIASTTSI